MYTHPDHSDDLGSNSMLHVTPDAFLFFLFAWTGWRSVVAQVRAGEAVKKREHEGYEHV